MQEVDLPVINNTMCEKMYRNAGYVEHIPNIFICAGYAAGGKDSCEVNISKKSVLLLTYLLNANLTRYSIRETVAVRWLYNGQMVASCSLVSSGKITPI